MSHTTLLNHHKLRCTSLCSCSSCFEAYGWGGGWRGEKTTSILFYHHFFLFLFLFFSQTRAVALNHLSLSSFLGNSLVFSHGRHGWAVGREGFDQNPYPCLGSHLHSRCPLGIRCLCLLLLLSEMVAKTEREGWSQRSCWRQSRHSFCPALGTDIQGKGNKTWQQHVVQWWKQ